MRTAFPLAVVLCAAVMGMMFVGSGFNGIVGADRGGDIGSQFESTAESEGVVDGDGEVVGGKAGDDGFFGLTVGGGKILLSILSLGGLFPDTLDVLGFPRWFYTPIGLVVDLLLTIGLIQFVIGREYV